MAQREDGAIVIFTLVSPRLCHRKNKNLAPGHHPSQPDTVTPFIALLNHTMKYNTSSSGLYSFIFIYIYLWPHLHPSLVLWFLVMPVNQLEEEKKDKSSSLKDTERKLSFAVSLFLSLSIFSSSPENEKIFSSSSFSHFSGCSLERRPTERPSDRA